MRKTMMSTSLLSVLLLAACGGSSEEPGTTSAATPTAEVSPPGMSGSGPTNLAEAPPLTEEQRALEHATVLASQHPQGEAFEVSLPGHDHPVTAVLKGDVALVGDVAVGQVQGSQILGAAGAVLAGVDVKTRQVLALPQTDRVKPLGSGIVNSPNQKWPNAVIPYEIDGNASQATRDAFHAAVADYHAKTVLRFVPRSNQGNFVRVITGDGCWSYVGTIGGRQDLSIGNGCGVNAARHELGHALGLAHEQVRQDRDNWVKVNLELTGNWRSQYEIDRGSAGTPIGSYDFQSMMHYNNSLVNGRWIFEPRNGFPADRVGNQAVNTFTGGDLQAIEAIYGRPNNGSQAPSNGPHTVHPHNALGLALDDYQGSTAAGNPIVVWGTNGSGAQRWVFNNNGVSPAGFYNLAVSFGAYCLTASGTSSGSAVNLQPCNGSASQAWRPNASNGGYTFNPANNTGLCLDVNGGGTTNGTRVQVWSCNNTSAQRWAIR